MNDRTFRLMLVLGLLFVVGTMFIRNRTVKFEIELESAPKKRGEDDDKSEEEQAEESESEG